MNDCTKNENVFHLARTHRIASLNKAEGNIYHPLANQIENLFIPHFIIVKSTTVLHVYTA